MKNLFHSSHPQIEENPSLVAAIHQQAEVSPPAVVRQRVMTAIHQVPQSSPMHWGLGIVSTLLILVTLWAVIQPGIVLQWSGQKGEVEAFQVYRATASSQDFTLVSQVPVEVASARYRFVDPLALPGQTYVYIIAGVDAEGRTAYSATVRENASGALPGHIAILVTALAVGLGVVGKSGDRVTKQLKKLTAR